MKKTLLHSGFFPRTSDGSSNALSLYNSHVAQTAWHCEDADYTPPGYLDVTEFSDVSQRALLAVRYGQNSGSHSVVRLGYGPVNVRQMPSVPWVLAMSDDGPISTGSTASPRKLTDIIKDKWPQIFLALSDRDKDLIDQSATGHEPLVNYAKLLDQLNESLIDATNPHRPREISQEIAKAFFQDRDPNHSFQDEPLAIVVIASLQHYFQSVENKDVENLYKGLSKTYEALRSGDVEKLRQAESFVIEFLRRHSQNIWLIRAGMSLYFALRKDEAGEFEYYQNLYRATTASPQRLRVERVGLEGPVNLFKEFWKNTVGRLPGRWPKRVAWGVPIASLVLGAYVFFVPEEAKVDFTPIQSAQEFVRNLFLDVDELKQRAQGDNEKDAMNAVERLAEVRNEEALRALNELRYDEGISDDIHKLIDESLDVIAEESGWIETLQEGTDPREKIEAIEELRKIGGNLVIDVFVDAFSSELDRDLTTPQDFEVRTHLKLAIHRVKRLHWPVVAEKFLGKERGELLWEASKLEDQIKIDSENSKLWMQLSQIYRQLRQTEKTKYAAEKSSDLSGQIQESEKKDPVTYVESEHLLGLVALESGEKQKAIGHFQNALNTNPDHVPALLDIARTYVKLEDYGAASEAYQQAFLLLQEPDAALSFSLGNSYLEQQEYGLAILMYEEGLGLDTSEENLGAVYTGLGICYDYKGQWGEALDNYQKSLDVFRALGDRHGMAVSHTNIGIVLESTGRLDEALRSHQRALDIFVSLGESHNVASTHNNMGNVYMKQRKWKEALGHYNISLVIKKGLKNRHGVAQTLNNIGIVLRNQRKLDEALEKFEESLAIFEDLGDHHNAAKSCMNMGNVYFMKGELDKALKYYKKSLKIFETLEDVYGMAKANMNMGNVYQRKDDLDKALEYYEKSFGIRKFLDDPLGMARVQGNMGFVYLKQGDLDQASRYTKESLRIFRELGSYSDVAMEEEILRRIEALKAQQSPEDR